MAVNRAQLRKAFESGTGTTEQRLKRAEKATPVGKKKKKAVKTKGGGTFSKSKLLEKTKRRLYELWHGEKAYLKKKK